MTSANSWNSLDIALKTKQRGTRQDSLMTRKHLERAENRQICSVDSVHVTDPAAGDQMPAQTCSHKDTSCQAYRAYRKYQYREQKLLLPFLIASIKTANAGGLAHSSLEDVGVSWRPYLASFHPDEGKKSLLSHPFPKIKTMKIQFSLSR